MIDAEKISIKSESLLSTQKKQMLLEMNYIVPDNKPRIHSVACVNVIPAISNSTFSGNAVNFNLSANCTMIYNAQSISEDEEFLFSTSCDFSKTFKDSIICEGDVSSPIYFLDVTVDNVESVIISDRKAVVKAYVTVSAMFKERNDNYAVKFFYDDSVVCKKNHFDLSSCIGNMNVQCFMKEDLTIDSNLPPAEAILTKNMSVKIDNKKISDGKAIFYGTAHIELLCSNTDCTPHFYNAEFDVNFNQSCEIPDCSSVAALKITPTFSEIIADPRENNIVSTELLISFAVDVYDTFSYDTIEDAFMPDMKLELKKADVTCSNIKPLSYNVGLCAEKISIPNSDIETALMAQISSSVCNSYVDDGNIYFEGMYTVKLTYIPKSNNRVICCATTETPFSYMFDCAMPDGEVCDCGIKINDVSLQPNDYGDVSVKWMAESCATVLSCCKTCVVCDAASSEGEPCDKAIYYHFITNDDSAWSISKQFGIKPTSLFAMNRVQNEDELLALKGAVIIKA